ncbi:MAG: hypothetical protein LBK95_18210, partial [Bifidobacteriaceae bacterium]|nr:hypothetical protein [Bifidobacteriaceae bacterium]
GEFNDTPKHRPIVATRGDNRPVLRRVVELAAASISRESPQCFMDESLVVRRPDRGRACCTARVVAQAGAAGGSQHKAASPSDRVQKVSTYGSKPVEIPVDAW